MEFVHKPIMLQEILTNLDIKENGTYIDCTMGGAGHGIEIIKKLSKNGLYIGLDKDDDAIAVCTQRLKSFDNVKIVKTDFKNGCDVLDDLGIDAVDGVLIDLGVSSYQLDNKERGFSFLTDAKLDMRMDQTQNFSAFDVVNNYSKQELVRVLRDYGEEEFANAISNNIISKRPIHTTKQLADIVEMSIPKKVIFKRGGAHKKTFQAIRIEVNAELLGLDTFLENIVKKVKKGGRVCVLTFHSLEDRIVKSVFKKLSIDCICPPRTPICICGHKASLKLINKKPLIASDDEMQENSRSTCAKLRVVEKI